MDTEGQPRILASKRLSAYPSLVHGFSTRAGGVSAGPFGGLNLGRGVGDDPQAVDENLARLARAADVPMLLTVSQVHGTEIAVVDHATDVGALEGLEADALITGTPGPALAVRTADCVPLLLYALDRGAVAAVHAGWRGTVDRIAARAVEAMTERFGASPDEVVGAVGPAIGPCCFEVGEEVAARFGGDLSEAVRRGGGRPHVDLVAANLAVLRAAGVGPERVDTLNACTACDPTRFFSHRRDRGRTGRHLSYIALRR